MRYLVTFFDKSTRRISEQAVPHFLKAMRDKDIIYHRGCAYAGSNISSIKTIVGYFRDKKDEACEQGRYFCKYGCSHESRAECGCKDTPKPPVLTEQENNVLKQLLLEPQQENKLLSIPQLTNGMS